MALEMKTACERCQAALEPAGDAFVCSYECSYCSACASALRGVCPNCTGELVARPRRLAKGAPRPAASGVQHGARVRWQRGAAPFCDNLYSRVHTWQFDGGVTLAASASPHVVKAPLSDPSAVDPEEAFVAVLSSCHMLWFLVLAARAGIVVDSYTDDASTGMTRLADGRVVVGPVVLRPVVTLAPGQGPLAERVEALHHEAHAQCFLANALRYPLEVEAALTQE